MQHKIIALNISELAKVTEKPRKKSEKSGVLEYNVSEKSLPLQRFNKAIDCITFFKGKRK